MIMRILYEIGYAFRQYNRRRLFYRAIADLMRVRIAEGGKMWVGKDLIICQKDILNAHCRFSGNVEFYGVLLTCKTIGGSFCEVTHRGKHGIFINEITEEKFNQAVNEKADMPRA